MAPPSRLNDAVGLSLIAAVWMMFFWPALFGSCQFGFRDTASLYYPLFGWIDRQWAAGEWPLWNPQDDFGSSTVGDTSSSVFYPGKLVFWFRFLSFDTRFAWYVASHALLAALGAWFAARIFGCRAEGATLAAISYGFGGAIVFQSCNVIFLVGAAWLPFALACAWKGNRDGAGRWLTAASGALAMMVLGGDPQMAFMSALVIVFLCFSAQDRRGWQKKAVAATGVTGLALSLSAIQVLPSLFWTARSERAAVERPVNIYQAIEGGQLAGLVAEPSAGSHASAIYEFSFAPWRVVEAVWPNVFGRFDFVREINWSSILPGSDRLWTPSVYLGVITLLLAVGQVSFRARRNHSPQWQLTWIGAFFLLGSFGWYGIGWLVNELQLMRGGAGFGPALGRPVGGLYWLMVTLLPGFSAFRYPCKLITVAALMASLLAARGVDRLATADPTLQRKLKRMAQGVLAGGVLVTALAIIAAERMTAGFRGDVLVAVLHTTVAMTALNFVVLRSRHKAPAVTIWLLVFLAVIDVTVANRGLNGFVPRWTGDHPGHETEVRAIYRSAKFELEELRDNGHNFQSRLHRDRLTLRPKHHLEGNRRLIGSFASIEPLDVLEWKLELRRREWAGDAAFATLLESCGVSEIVEPDESLPSSSGEKGFRIRQLPGEPLFSAVGQWQRLDEVDARDPAAVRRRTRDVFDSIVANGKDHVVVEANDFALAPKVWPPDSAPPSCRIIQYRPAMHELEVTVPGDALLLCREAFDVDWKAELIGDDGQATPLRIVRANRVQRAVALRAGRSRVIFSYRPRGLIAGAALSAAAWLAWLALLVFGNMMQRPRTGRLFAGRSASGAVNV